MGRLAQTLGLFFIVVGEVRNDFLARLAFRNEQLDGAHVVQDVSHVGIAVFPAFLRALGHDVQSVVGSKLSHRLPLKSPGFARLKHKRDRRLRLTLAVSPPLGRLIAQYPAARRVLSFSTIAPPGKVTAGLTTRST